MLHFLNYTKNLQKLRYAFIQLFWPEYISEGGRRCHNLMELVGHAKKITHVFVTIGANDAKSRGRYICCKFEESRDAFEEFRVFFRKYAKKDLSPDLESKNNMVLGNKLGYQLKITKIIRRQRL